MTVGRLAYVCLWGLAMDIGIALAVLLIARAV